MTAYSKEIPGQLGGVPQAAASVERGRDGLSSPQS